MKKFLANQKGSTYLYTIVSFSILFLILSSCIRLTSNQVKSTASTIKNSNLYYLALSGAEKMVDTLNRAIYLNSATYLEKSIEKINAASSDEINYTSDLTELGVYQKALSDSINTASNYPNLLSGFLPYSNRKYTYTLEYNIIDENDTSEYNIKVTLERTMGIGDYNITSTATNSKTNTELKITAKTKTAVSENEITNESYKNYFYLTPNAIPKFVLYDVKMQFQ